MMLETDLLERNRYLYKENGKRQDVSPPYPVYFRNRTFIQNFVSNLSKDIPY